MAKAAAEYPWFTIGWLEERTRYADRLELGPADPPSERRMTEMVGPLVARST